MMLSAGWEYELRERLGCNDLFPGGYSRAAEKDLEQIPLSGTKSGQLARENLSPAAQELTHWPATAWAASTCPWKDTAEQWSS